MTFSRTLSGYIGRQFFFWFVSMTLALVAVFMLFDTLELFRRASARDTDIGFRVVLTMALLKLPSMVEKTVLFSVLLGAMFAFFRLNRHQEFVVARAAGVSVWQFLAPPIAIAVLIGIFKIAVFNPLSSATLQKFETLEARYLRGQTSLASLANRGLWFRQATGEGHYVLHARSIAPRDGRLDSVIVFLLGQDDRFLGRLDARSATLEEGYWRLDNAVLTTPDAPPVSLELRRLPTDLTTENITDSFSPPETISFWALPGFIRVLESAGFSGIRHLIHWYSHLALPFMLASVVILAATVSLRPVRRGGTALLIVSGIVTGFVLYFMTDVVYVLGASSKIPALMAAGSPAVVSMSIGIAILFHLEDG
jgi:lipopolysaccharide export system permease protein